MRVSLVTSRILLHSTATSFAPLRGSSRCPIPHQCYISEHAAATLLAYDLLQAHGNEGIVHSYGENIEPDTKIQGPPDVAYKTRSGYLWCGQVVRASSATSLAETVARKVVKSCIWLASYEKKDPDLRLPVERFFILVWVPSLIHCFTLDYLRASRLAHAVSQGDPRLVVRVLVPGNFILRDMMFPPRFGEGRARSKFDSFAILLMRVQTALASLLELSTTTDD